MKNSSTIPQYPRSREVMMQDAASRAGYASTEETLPCNPQARRQLKRMHWILLIACLLLAGNILAIVTGQFDPLYDMSRPSETPVTLNTATDTR